MLRFDGVKQAPDPCFEYIAFSTCFRPDASPQTKRAQLFLEENTALPWRESVEYA